MALCGVVGNIRVCFIEGSAKSRDEVRREKTTRECSKEMIKVLLGSRPRGLMGKSAFDIIVSVNMPGGEGVKEKIFF